MEWNGMAIMLTNKILKKIENENRLSKTTSEMMM